jgi:hypothetical protein
MFKNLLLAGCALILSMAALPVLADEALIAAESAKDKSASTDSKSADSKNTDSESSKGSETSEGSESSKPADKAKAADKSKSDKSKAADKSKDKAGAKEDTTSKDKTGSKASGKDKSDDGKAKSGAGSNRLNSNLKGKGGSTRKKASHDWKPIAKQAASFVSGAVLGAPVAFARISYLAEKEQTKSIPFIGERKNPIAKGTAMLLVVPSSMFSGAIQAPYYSIMNSWKQSQDEPFSKESFGFGEMEEKYINN